VLWTIVVLTSPGAIATGGEDRGSDRPNIVLIMADDVGYECFGCYGSEQYRTPRIDRMARRGMRFTHCYSQPLCTPSRVKLMTGLSNARNYSAFSVLNSDQKTIGHYFRDADYRTLIAGKWQLLGAKHYPERFRHRGTWPSEAGFQHHCLWQVARLGNRYWQPLLTIDGKDRQFPADQYGPEIATRHITDFIAKQAASRRPFFVYYPMVLVHDPFRPTPDSPSRKQRGAQRNFEDMVAYMDTLVGRIVDAVADAGEADQTLFLFTGDNGTHRAIRSSLHGRTIRGGKGRTTDAGTRVPLVAYWPSTVPADTVCDDLVDFSDFLPTLLEAAGESIPKHLDGRTFLPQLLGEQGDPRQWIYCFYCPRPERNEPIRFVRDQRWKLYGDGRFFDILSDRTEQHPLEASAMTPAALQAKRKLQKALQSMPAQGQMLLTFPDDDA
jgi:arylsulfatase A